MAQSQNSVEALRGLPMGISLIIALGASVALTVLIWKLGVIRFMVNVQNQRQARVDNVFDQVDKHPEQYTDKQKRSSQVVGRKSLYSYQFGTGKSAALGFTSAFWLISFCLILFGLIVYA